MGERREHREGVGRAGLAKARRLGAAVVAVVFVVALAACEPSAPPGFTAAPSPPAGPAGSASVAPQASAVAGSPTLTVDGTTVRIVGLGNGVSPDFDLPAGSAAMTVSLCSNQVIPFVTLFDSAGTKLGIIVEPEYDLKNLVGGTYHIEVQSNPACAWTIEVTPA